MKKYIKTTYTNNYNVNNYRYGIMYIFLKPYDICCKDKVVYNFKNRRLYL